MTIKTLKSLREDQSFDLFWMKVNQFVSLHHARGGSRGGSTSVVRAPLFSINFYMLSQEFCNSSF